MILSLLLTPALAFAMSYDTTHLPYSDIPNDLETQVSVSTLTQMGIVEGYADGTFRAGVSLNRAEFMKIAMGLLPPDKRKYARHCFSDVDANIWFAEPVCRAKELGIVSGNALPGLAKDAWPFEPARAVHYEEALKILAGIYAVPLVEASGGAWFDTYMKTAQKLRIDLQDSAPGSSLTRGQMARLTVAFTAYTRGELSELRAAEGSSSSMSSVSSSKSSLSSSSVSSVSSASSVSSSSTVYDTLPDGAAGDNVLVLGKVTPVLGAAKLFSNSEPIDIEDFLVDLVASNSSVQVFNVYAQDGKLLGRATLDPSVSGNLRYRLGAGALHAVVPYRQNYSFYVRAVLSQQDAGGTSGQEIQINRMGIRGTGSWSTRSYEQFTSGTTYGRSTTARSAITSIVNAGPLGAALTAGPAQEVGVFTFAGSTGQSSAALTITAVTFQIEGVGVTLTNPYLMVAGASDRHDCGISGTQIVCSGLPADFGSIKDGPKTLRVYADIAVTLQSPTLRITINDPGTIDTPGSITWTDGVTTFTWIESDTRPVARGTYYSY